MSDSNVKLDGCMTIGCARPIGPHLSYYGEGVTKHDKHAQPAPEDMTKFNFCIPCFRDYVSPVFFEIAKLLQKDGKQ